MKGLYQPFQLTLTESGLKCFGLSLQYTPPCKALTGIVHSYLQICAVKPTPYPVLPDGTQAIFVSPDGLMIGGAQTHAHDVQILQPGDYFGIRFYPGTLRHFFQLNLAEITDRFVGSDYIPCADFCGLHHRIYQQREFHHRANLCQQWLLQHYNPWPFAQFDHALYLIYQSLGSIKVSQLASIVGWSSRHLNRTFTMFTGMSTKTFAQIVRVQNASRFLYLAPGSSMKTAHELGYFDQSHLINDYKKYLLNSPSRFAERFLSGFSDC